MIRWVARTAVVLGLASPSAHAQAYDDPETERVLCKLDGSCPETEPASVAATTEPASKVGTTVVAAPREPKRARGIALARNALVVTLTLEASVGHDAMLDRTSIAPDVAYGLTDRVTLSLAHSGFATTGFRGSAGGGLCMTGEARGCTHAYHNGGVDAVVDVIRGRFAVAAVGGVHAVSIEPAFVDLKLGAQAAYHRGAITATLSPSVFVGVTERERGNRGTVFVPASAGVQLTRSWFAALGGGVATPLADATGGWTARLGAIARYRVRSGLFVAGSLFLPKLAGGTEVEGAGLDARVANVWVTYSP